MKKIILFIILLLFCYPNDINAEIDLQEIEVTSEEDIVINTSVSSGNVKIYEDRSVLYFSSAKQKGYWWKNMFVDGQFAYCVEPDVISNEIGFGNTTNPSDVMSQQQWVKYSLIALYAEQLYGDAQDIGFRYAAQILIHEDVAPQNGKIHLYSYASGSKKEFFVDSHKSVILSKLASHNIVPNFDFGEGILKVGEVYTFEDINHTLSNFEVTSSDSKKMGVSTNGNNLFLDVKEKGEASVLVLAKYNLNAKGILFWSSPHNQDLITTTEIEYYKKNYNFRLEEKKGSLKIIKQDEQTKHRLNNAQFLLEREVGGKFIKHSDIKVVENGEIVVNNLDLGRYKLTETKAPKDYRLDTKPYFFDLVDDKQIIDIVVDNHKKKGGILITKQDAETKERISSTKFLIEMMVNNDYLHIGEFEVDANGELALNNLDLGTYRITETAANDRYILDNKPVIVELQQDEKIIKVNIDNYKKKGGIKLMKVDGVTNKRLNSTTFLLQKLVNDEYIDVDEYTVNEEGVLSIIDLELGFYRLVEVKANENYVLNDQPYEVVISEHNEVIEIIAENFKKLGTLSVIKVDGDTNERLTSTKFLLQKYIDNGYSDIGEYEVNELGELTVPNLELGMYKLIETQASENYILDGQPRFFEITEHEQLIEFVVENYINKGGIKIVKLDGNTRERIAGVEFLLRKQVDGQFVDIATYTTDNNGEIIIDNLQLTNYQILEISPSSGYVLDETIREVNLLENGVIVEVEILNFKVLPQSGNKAFFTTFLSISSILLIVRKSPIFIGKTV